MKPTARDIALAMQAQSPNPVWVKERKARAKPKREEDSFQISVFEYLAFHPRILSWSNTKQVFRGKTSWAQINYLRKLQRMGAKKGLSDVCIFFRNKHGNPTFCVAELKKPTGQVKTSDEQVQFMEDVNRRGGYSAVVRSIEDLQELLRVAGY